MPGFLILRALLISTLLSIRLLACDLFETVDPDVFRYGNLTSCAKAVLGSSVTSIDRSLSSSLACAGLCSSFPACVAFLFDDRCSLLSSVCKPEKQTKRLMLRRKEYPSKLKWSFQRSKYILTQENGTFWDMQKVCARLGMYVWIPNTKAEMDFVENEVLKKLPEPYKIYKIWIGVLDRPNKQCKLPDESGTKCPVTNYAPDQPNYVFEECNQYLYKNGTLAWNDLKCKLDYYALCEARK